MIYSKSNLFSVNLYSTEFNAMDPKSESSISFLSQIKIECPEQEILSSFVYEQNDQNQFKYNYQCISLNTKQVSRVFANNWSLWGKWNYASANSRRLGNVNFLDRQTVDCGRRGYLTSLETENNNATGSIRYIYKCAKATNVDVKANNCFERKTKKADSEDFYLPSLQYHHVQCNENEGLLKFVLQVDYKAPRGHVWYKYSCCELFD